MKLKHTQTQTRLCLCPFNYITNFKYNLVHQFTSKLFSKNFSNYKVFFFDQDLNWFSKTGWFGYSQRTWSSATGTCFHPPCRRRWISFHEHTAVTPTARRPRPGGVPPLPSVSGEYASGAPAYASFAELLLELGSSRLGERSIDHCRRQIRIQERACCSSFLFHPPTRRIPRYSIFAVSSLSFIPPLLSSCWERCIKF